jgi:hypothetical protein
MDEPWRIYARAMQTQADAGGTVGPRGHLRVADVLAAAAEVTTTALVERGWPWLVARALALRLLDRSVGWVVSDEGPEALEERLREEWERVRPAAPGQSEWAGLTMRLLAEPSAGPALTPA